MLDSSHRQANPPLIPLQGAADRLFFWLGPGSVRQGFLRTNQEASWRGVHENSPERGDGADRTSHRRSSAKFATRKQLQATAKIVHLGDAPVSRCPDTSEASKQGRGRHLSSSASLKGRWMV